MGFLDNWLHKFLSSRVEQKKEQLHKQHQNQNPHQHQSQTNANNSNKSSETPIIDKIHPSTQIPQSGANGANRANGARANAESTQGTNQHAVIDPAAQVSARVANLEEAEYILQQARARLAVGNQDGKNYAESRFLLETLERLDGMGRSRAADALLADALLLTPSRELRKKLAERLLYRGERQQARTLLTELAKDDTYAVFALSQLGELAEVDGDTNEALRCYENVLAVDMTQEQIKVRARRLRAGRDERMRYLASDGRALLARLLGARAAGARYAVVEEIGRGGAATVFRARDRTVGRDVALKIFHPRGSAIERRNRILEEARLTSILAHPHIVPILDVDESRDLLVMALCDGGSLRQLLDIEKRLRFIDAIEHGAILLRTLADIHAAGHAHLDIKPSNLLLHRGQLLLCDFGVAGLMGVGAVGTRAYMAPEYVMAAQATASADVYAAGLVIYECLEGHLPTTTGMALSLPSLPPSPRRRALEAILAALTARLPEDRPAASHQMAQLLLAAAALPTDDKEGVRLHQELEEAALHEPDRRLGDMLLRDLDRHPLVKALQNPEEVGVIRITPTLSL